MSENLEQMINAYGVPFLLCLYSYALGRVRSGDMENFDSHFRPDLRIGIVFTDLIEGGPAYTHFVQFLNNFEEPRSTIKARLLQLPHQLLKLGFITEAHQAAEYARWIEANVKG